MPEPPPKVDIRPRQAGAGSLGRPRWVARAKWRGAPVVREAKVLVPSAWNLPKDRGGFSIRWNEIATGHYRAPDPWFRLTDNIVVRRLSPNNRKIEAKKPKDREVLLSEQMLKAMGRELSSIHLGSTEGRHRQPRAAALLRRRPVAGRFDRARGEGDGPLGLDARARRRAPAALRRDRAAARIAAPDPTYHLRGQRAGAAAFAQRLQDRGRTAEEEGRRPKTRRSKRAAAAADQARMLQAMGHELASIHRGTREKDDIEADLEARDEGWLLAAATAVSAPIAAEQRDWKKHPDEMAAAAEALIGSINKLHCRGGARMGQSSAKHKGENAMPRPSVADKRRAFRKLHESGCFVIPNPWDVGLGALPAGPRLQGAGLDSLRPRVVGGSCRQRGRGRHGAGASRPRSSPRPTCR